MRSVLLAAVAALMALGCGDDDPPPASEDPPDDSLMPEMDIEGDGVTLHVWLTGNLEADKTIVLLSGGPGWSSRYMTPLESLGDGTQKVVRFDPRGTGQSTIPDPWTNRPDAMARDVEAIRARIEAETIHLVAHNHGLVVAGAYLQAFPQHVASVFVIDGWAPNASATLEGYAAFDTKQAALQGAGKVPDPLPPDEGDDCGAEFRAVLPTYFFDVNARPPQEVRGTSCHRTVSNSAWADSIGANYDYSTALLNFTGPAQVMFGKNDPLGTQIGQFLVNAFSNPDYEYIVLPAAGHFVWTENAEALGDVRAFLAPLP